MWITRGTNSLSYMDNQAEDGSKGKEKLHNLFYGIWQPTPGICIDRMCIGSNFPVSLAQEVSARSTAVFPSVLCSHGRGSMRGSLSCAKQHLRVNALQSLSLTTCCSKDHYSTEDSKQMLWNMQCFIFYI